MSERAHETTSLAAVDLGSNSFKLVVADEVDGAPRYLDVLRERVALAEGLRADGEIEPAVEERALACLARFGQRLAGIPAERVRAVGTATLRKVPRRGFLQRAEQALGHEIEVLPGREEARLTYLGVAHTLGEDSGRRLVVDIGGSSTECIIGERFESVRERSLSMGCVRWSLRFFPDGRITRRRMEEAEIAARLELEPIEREFRELGWNACIGSSGTIEAVAEVVAKQGWGHGTITARGLSKLTRVLVAAGSFSAIAVEGLKEERRAVIAGGLAILRGVFAGLGIREMAPSKGALRDGLIYDLLGRIHQQDVRMRSVRDFARRFGVDEAHGQRVRATALALFEDVRAAWELGPSDRRLLGWAAEAHEVGLAVSWLAHHKHGAYLMQNGDLPGFSQERRDRLAWLVRAHRRSIPPLDLEGISAAAAKASVRLALLLRLAVRLHRSRDAAPLPPIVTKVEARRITLTFPAAYLAGHPLTRAELEDEAGLLKAAGYELEVA